MSSRSAARRTFLGLCVAVAFSFALVPFVRADEPEPPSVLPTSETTDCSPSVVTESVDGVLQGTACDDLILADGETETVYGGDGNDVVIGSTDTNSIKGGDGDDLIFVNGAAETFGGADDDTIFGEYSESIVEDSDTAAQILGTLEDSLGAQTTDEALTSQFGSGSNLRKGSVAMLTGDTPSSGDDLIYGGSGNDIVDGLGGNDQLFGNIGDDTLSGNTGNDLVAGGQGVDTLNGGDGNDWTRGDGTQDHILEADPPDSTGDQDTLSFASGVTPGFDDSISVTGFPSTPEGRGVYVNIPSNIADNGIPGDAGGQDTNLSDTDLSRFERIVGTPFDDFIVGTTGTEIIDGGGGSDIIWGLGGNDYIFGGTGGDNIAATSSTTHIDGGPGTDYCDPTATNTDCNETGSSSSAVVQRDPTKVAVGFITPLRTLVAANDFQELYVKGSSGADNIVVTYNDAGGSYASVNVKLNSGTFDTTGNEDSGCDYSAANPTPPTKPLVTCTYYKGRPLDSVLIAGMGGNDTIDATSSSSGYDFPLATSLMVLGGTDNDTITTGDGFDQLVDGPGQDTLSSGAGDDGLINNTGPDTLNAGSGDDLLLTTIICESVDSLNGGGSGEKNNASWAQLGSGGKGVNADLPSGEFGEFTPGNSTPSCPGGVGNSTLSNIVNLEGSIRTDRLTGGGLANSLIGYLGPDVLTGNSGNDVIASSNVSINGTSNTSDLDYVYGGDGSDNIRTRDGYSESVINCGADTDTGYRDSNGIDGGQVDSNCDGNLAPP